MWPSPGSSPASCSSPSSCTTSPSTPLFAAVGCFAAAVVAVVAPDAIAAQVVAAVLVTAAGILLVRPRVSDALSRHGGHRGRGVHGGFVGQRSSRSTSSADPTRSATSMLAGERWLAVSGADVPLPAGTRVLITGVEGTTLIVWPADGHLPIDGSRRRTTVRCRRRREVTDMIGDRSRRDRRPSPSRCW